MSKRGDFTDHAFVVYNNENWMVIEVEEGIKNVSKESNENNS